MVRIYFSAYVKYSMLTSSLPALKLQMKNKKMELNRAYSRPFWGRTITPILHSRILKIFSFEMIENGIFEEGVSKQNALFCSFFVKYASKNAPMSQMARINSAEIFNSTLKYPQKLSKSYLRPS